MTGLTSIALLARSTLSKPLEIEEEIPESAERAFDKNAAILITSIESKLKSSIFTVENISLIVPVLLLCGENSAKGIWNEEAAVRASHNLLLTLCERLEIKHVSHLFTNEQLLSITITEIKPKLEKSCFKRNPATLQCFIWILENTKHPHVDEILTLVLPITLTLLDDFEASYQKKGLNAIQHILSETTRTALQHLGWAAVINDALKVALYRDVDDIVQVFTCKDLCLNVLCPNARDSSQWINVDQYDTTLCELLRYMEMEQSDEARRRYLNVLTIFVRSMRIRFLRFLPSLCTLLDAYVTEESSLDLCLQSLEVLVEVLKQCWPCKDLDSMESITWLVFKAHHRMSIAGDQHTMVSTIQCCLQLIGDLSPRHRSNLETIMNTS